MKSFISTAALAAGLALMPIAAHAQAAAPTATANGNIAVLDLEQAVAESAAYKAASAQIQATYKAQITAYQTRETALQTEMQGLQTELQNLQKNPATPKATLDAKVAAAQARARTAQQELQRLALPFARPDAYAQEQIQAKMDQAVKAAMTAKKVGILLKPDAVMAFMGGMNLTTDVVTQLNALIPSASITPPANWQPGQNEPAQPAAPAAGR